MMSKYFQAIVLLGLFTACSAFNSKKVCKKYPIINQDKRNVKFLIVLMRHGARAVNNPSIWNDYFKTFKPDEFGILNGVGKDQALLSGINLRLNYPNFMRHLKAKDITLEAKDLERTIDTAKGFADGSIRNLRTLDMSKLSRNMTFPPWHTSNKQRNYCFKYLLTEQLIYLLKNEHKQDHTNPDWKVSPLTGVPPSEAWEDHSDVNCTDIIKEIDQFVDKTDPLKSETVNKIKEILKVTDNFIDLFKKLGRDIDSLTQPEVYSLSDFCKNANTVKEIDFCPKNLMKLIKIVYSYKFFGKRTWQQSQVYASVFAKKYADILNAFQEKPTKQPKLHLLGKSDSMIAPFYSFMRLTPPRQFYIDWLKTSNECSKLPTNPQFADTLVTEISKKGKKYYVRLFRDGKKLLLPQCGETHCELGMFIKKIRQHTLSLPEVQKKCGVSPTRRLLNLN